ncbi:methyltransferase [Allostella sp. ATCC 35155]|nr:methyltransferase [Stella sp. ATCC 35155]
MHQEDYAIEGGRPGKERLDLLSDVFRPTTRRLLERAGLAPGMRCLDVGCGGGGVTLDLARRVGPEGRVVGLDFDPAVLALARADAASRGLDNVEFRTGNAMALDLAGQFDLVYARFLLTHLPRPEAALAAMVTAVRPGGVVVVEDIDFSGQFCEPECPAFATYLRLYREVVLRKGGDPDIGRRLPTLLRAAGIPRVNPRAVQHLHERGRAKLLSLVTLRRIAPAVRAEGLADQHELRATIDALDAFTVRRDSMIGLPRIFQVWGTRPAGG